MRRGGTLLSVVVVLAGCVQQSDKLTLEEAQEAYELVDDQIATLNTQRIDADIAYKETGDPKHKAISDKLDGQIGQELKESVRLKRRIKELEGKK